MHMQNLMHKHIPKCKYTHINARILDIKVHMDKNIKMEDKLYAHTDEQTHQQAIVQRVLPFSTVATIRKHKHVPTSHSRLLQPNAGPPPERTLSSASPTEYHVTIICLILRVKAAENLPESRKYYQTKII